MIGALAQLLAAIGVPARIARVLAIGALVMLAILAVWIGFAIHDARVVARHQADATAQTATADRAADAQSATRRRADDARLEAEADALERVTDDVSNAAQSDVSRDPLAARRAYYACVRVQQQARAAGRLAPACR